MHDLFILFSVSLSTSCSISPESRTTPQALSSFSQEKSQIIPDSSEVSKCGSGALWLKPHCKGLTAALWPRSIDPAPVCSHRSSLKAKKPSGLWWRGCVYIKADSHIGCILRDASVALLNADKYAANKSKAVFCQHIHSTVAFPRKGYKLIHVKYVGCFIPGTHPVRWWSREYFQEWAQPNWEGFKVSSKVCKGLCLLETRMSKQLLPNI